MPLTASERRALAARGNRLKAGIAIGDAEVSDAVADNVRRSFIRTDLVKVRVNTDDRDGFARIVEQLAARVPCEIVQRVGRVALCYRPRADARPDATASEN